MTVEKTLLIVEDDRPLRERLARAERRPGKVRPRGFPSGRATNKKAMA